MDLDAPSVEENKQKDASGKFTFQEAALVSVNLDISSSSPFLSDMEVTKSVGGDVLSSTAIASSAPMDQCKLRLQHNLLGL